MTSKNSEFWQANDYVALDIETTGLDPQTCEIIEIGAVRFKGGKESEQFSVLVKPTEKVPTFIKQLTGIKESDLEHGISIKQALTDLLEFIRKDKIVCHNSSFDISFIQNNLTLHLFPPLTNIVFDTLEMSRIYLPFIQNHKLNTLVNTLQIEGDGKYHRALDDALMTGRVFARLTDFILEHIPFELNTSLLDVIEYTGDNGSEGDFIREVVSYQRVHALTRQSGDPNIGLLQSDLAHSLGFSGSHNLIRTENWDRDRGENDDVVFGAEKDDNDGHTGTLSDKDSIISLSFSGEGYLSRNFPDYEYRDGQIEMAEGVESALKKEEFLVVEAGTGIGKTLAYLIPALNFAYQRGCRVYVSTNTKNLQEQLFFKDLPIIKNSVPVPFQAVILKGRENYLCIRKWNEIRLSYRKQLTPAEARSLLYLLVWQRYTRSGDISENSSFNRESDTDTRRQYSATWRKLAAERYFCPGRKCPEYARCYYMIVRKKSEISSLVVTNHSLLLTDLSFDRFNEEEKND